MAAVSTIVLKLGGEVVHSPELDVIAAELSALGHGGTKIAIVHGGGPQATALQKTLGLETKMIAGRRFTDPATLDVMKYVVGGQLNFDLCARLLAKGVKALGLHGASGHMIQAKKRPPKVIQGAGPDPVDLGLVGDVTGFNVELLTQLFGLGYVPVLACLGCDPAGQALNINGDTVASQLAGALKADALLLITSTPGVLRDVKDPTTRIGRITRPEFDALCADGTISGGMIPKLQESFDVLKGGAKSVVIVGKPQPGELVQAIREPGSVGTVLVP